MRKLRVLVMNLPPDNAVSRQRAGHAWSQTHFQLADLYDAILRTVEWKQKPKPYPRPEPLTESAESAGPTVRAAKPVKLRPGQLSLAQMMMRMDESG